MYTKLKICAVSVLVIVICVLTYMQITGHKPTDVVEITAINKTPELTAHEDELNEKLTNKQTAILKDDRYTKVVLTPDGKNSMTVILPPGYSIGTTDDSSALVTFKSDSKVDRIPVLKVNYTYIEPDDVVSLKRVPIIDTFLDSYDKSKLTESDIDSVTDSAYALFSSIPYTTDKYVHGIKAEYCEANFCTLQTSMFDENQRDIVLPIGYYDFSFGDGVLRIVISYHNPDYIQLFNDIMNNNYKLDDIDYETIETETISKINECYEVFIENTLLGDYSQVFNNLMRK